MFKGIVTTSSNNPPSRSKAISFIIKKDQCKERANISTKSTTTNSINNVPNKNLKQPLTLKKVSSVANLRKDVIKLAPSSSIKKLWDKREEKRLLPKNELAIEEGVNGDCITPKGSTLKRLRVLFSANKKPPPAKTFNTTMRREGLRNIDVVKVKSKESRNINNIKHGTCIKLSKKNSIDNNREEESYENNETVIEHACDNDYSLIYNSLNNFFI